jgi:bifunctional DNA-binding transcriptional regulator/antitoxin component of YhaV-PrlF toxin-antitoxin module
MSISDKTAIVNEQGQILIPDVLREQQLNLAPGTRVVLWLEGSRLILQEINEFVSSLPDTGSQCAGKRPKDSRQCRNACRVPISIHPSHRPTVPENSPSAVQPEVACVR